MTGASLQLMQGMMAKILPLYAVMILGFVFGRLRPQAGEPLSYLQVYFMVPFVTLSGLANMEFRPEYLLLPVIVYICCSLVGFVTLTVGKKFWNDSTPYISAYMCGCANTGYYGIPVALILFPQETLGLFMVSIVGFTLFECTLGYYWVARGQYTVRDSLRKLARLPLIYAFIVGLICSALGQHVPDFAKDITRDLRGFYVIGGALMIGMGLSRLKHFRLESGLIAYVFAFKFLVWPILALALIAFDNGIAHLFSEQVHKIFVLVAIMPLPANAVAYALQLNVQPDKASTLVFISTLFALFYIPLIMVFWG